MAVSNAEIERILNESDDDLDYSSDSSDDFQPPSEPEVSDESENDSDEESENNVSDHRNGNGAGDPGQTARRGRGRPRRQQNHVPVANAVWTEITDINAYPPRIPFQPTRLPGYHPPTPVPKSELDFFQLFFTDELLLSIVNETNRYATEKIQMCTPKTRFSQWNDWEDVTVSELKAFLGVLMNMAVNEKPSLKDYFSVDWTIKQDFFSDVFSRKRFLQIFRALHVADPKTTTTKDRSTRSSKINNLWRYIDSASKKYYSPHESLSVDESTVGFKGRIAFKCYNKDKPTKWGMKIFVLVDPSTGYVSAIEPYFGQPTTDSLIRQDLPFTARIVVHLYDRLLRDSPATGHHIYIDRYYSGCELTDELKKMGAHVTGTVMSNRKGLPMEAKGKKLNKMRVGDVKAFRSGDKVVLAWKDKRPVLLLSTYHNAASSDWRRQGPNGGEVLQKPLMIQDYTSKMGGVDRADYLCTSYSFLRKSLK